MAEKADLVLSDSDEDTSEDDDNTVDDATPSPRFWHFSQLVEGNVYVGGGNIPQYKKTKARARLLRTIEEFSVEERKWRQRETTGDHHPGLTAVACASFGKYLFAYGGNDAKDLNGVLSQLDLDTFIWSQLSPETADGPMKKDATGMVHFGEDGLAVMCGYATPRDRMQLNGGSSDRASKFIIREGPSAEGGGWTNEMHIFNHKTDNHPGMWTPFSFEGPRPPPCADFSLTSVDLYRAVLYGGDRGADENSDDLYVIDFSEKKIMKIRPESKEDKWPKMRLGQHAACCLDFNTNNPQLLISGGRIKHDIPSKDIWILNLATQKWKQVELPIDDDSIKSQLARWGHTFTAIPHSEGLIEVIMFGGTPGYYEVTWDVYKGKDFRRLSFPVSFILGFLKNKGWVILDVLDCSAHWTSKTTESMPFDLDSPIMLDVLYSMERDEIPIITELVTNKKIRSTICIEDKEAHSFKWPTFTRASFHKPIWEKLISILKLVQQDDLIKMIQEYLNKMKGQAQQEGKEEIPTHKREDPKDIKIEILKKENKKLRNHLESLEKLQQDIGKEKVTAQAHDFELPGVDVCGETTFVVTHNADVFKWEEYGLELCVSEDSIPKDMDECKISIIASIAGQYQFPETFSLVSAVFWLRCEPIYKFSKAITMKMEHCAKSENANLSFVRTFCTQKKLPYIFEKIGGCFTKTDGTIGLKHFSGVGIGGDPPNQEYCARIFYLSQQRVTSYEIDFIVTSNLKAHHTVVKEEYKGKFAEAGIERTFFFESDSITIDIPLRGVEIEEGWKIKPLTNPVVLKQIVDSYEEGKVIPKCQFSAKAMIQDGEEVPPLEYQATLLGAKYPDNIVTFNMTPPSRITFGSSHEYRKRSRPASESDAAPRAKRVILRKTKSQDPNISIISEDTSVDDIPPSCSTQAGSMQHQLDENSLHDVIDKVISVSANYYNLGLALRLQPGNLDRVREENQQNTRAALRDVLLLWLRKMYDVEKYGPPTWEMLVEAISKESGGNNEALGQQIAKRLSSIKPQLP